VCPSRGFMWMYVRSPSVFERAEGLLDVGPPWQSIERVGAAGALRLPRARDKLSSCRASTDKLITDNRSSTPAAGTPAHTLLARPNTNLTPCAPARHKSDPAADNLSLNLLRGSRRRGSSSRNPNEPVHVSRLETGET
jgi:hypothetical protein